MHTISGIPPASPSPEATLSAYYKGADKKLHRLQSVIATDPEGVTEEDVERMRKEAYQHLRQQSMMSSVVAEQKDFVEPVLVVVQGGKR